ncbi:PorV/PorQ family protein [bacterium]|nr:PorV/PorQ family protein [bacterium]
MKYLRLTALFLSLMLVAASVRAAKYAGDAFSLGVGGRGLAMGGAVIAGPFDATAAYWNPAGMNLLDGRYVGAMHAETFGSLLNHDYLSYIDARPNEQGRLQAFGFYVYYLGGGGIKITQLNEFDRPEVIREESHGDFLFSAALSGKLWSKVDFGLTGKIIYRDIGTESGYGLTMDAGALYQAYPFARIGVTVTDITTGFIRYSGKTFDSGANTESIYPTVKPGLMLEHTISDFTGRFAMSGDIKFEGIKYGAQYWQGNISLDTHYGWEIGWREMVFGRAGFDIGRFTAGGGVNIRDIAVDFAYLHDDALDETFRVSAGYRF